MRAWGTFRSLRPNLWEERLLWHIVAPLTVAVSGGLISWLITRG